MGNEKISVHHIGGRKSVPAFPALNAFEQDLVTVLYDADEDCIEQIKQINHKEVGEQYVFPYCLFSHVSSSTLNINYDPYTSSLYKFNPDYKSHYYFDGVTDYVFGETCKTMEERKVDLVTLDSLCHHTSAFPKPDYLSLDTQGSEWDILAGGKNTLGHYVLAVNLEVEFHPLYQGQKVFGDISDLLVSLGFQFVKFEYLGVSSPYRACVGLRGDGFQTSGDALYFKKIDYIGGETDIEHFLMLQKMAFFAIAHNQFEYGLECLGTSRECARSARLSTEEFEKTVFYCRFLNELEMEIKRMRQYFPMTFAEECTFEASKARFVASGKAEGGRSVKEWLRKFPILFRVLKAIKMGLTGDSNPILLIHLYVWKRYSLVEKVLVKYGMKNQAENLRRKRLIQSRYIHRQEVTQRVLQ